MATLKNPRPAVEPLLQDLFNWSIKRPAETAAITRTAGREEMSWRREVNIPYSAVDRESARPVPATLTVTLAAQGRQVFFSPDEAQVSRALDTVAKRYPSMADTLPRESVSLATIRPSALASLGRREALTMLPRADEPVFRTAAEQHLAKARCARPLPAVPVDAERHGQSRPSMGSSRVAGAAAMKRCATLGLLAALFTSPAIGIAQSLQRASTAYTSRSAAVTRAVARLSRLDGAHRRRTDQRRANTALATSRLRRSGAVRGR